MKDLFLEVCEGLPEILREAAEEVDFGRQQVRELANELSDANVCYREFWQENPTLNEFDPGPVPNGSLPEEFPSHTWDVPSSYTDSLDNITNLEIAVIDPRVFDIEFPSDPADWISCQSNGYNDEDQPFLEHEIEPGFTYDLDSGSMVVGGMIGSTYVQASGPFASASTSCSTCSFVNHRAEEDGVINALVLDSPNPVDLTWNMSPPLLSPDSFRLALYEPVQVTEVGWKHYRAAPGTAKFAITYADGTGPNPVFIATNDNNLDIKKSGSPASWKIKPFQLKYEDTTGETWGVYISELSFEP